MYQPHLPLNPLLSHSQLAPCPPAVPQMDISGAARAGPLTRFIWYPPGITPVYLSLVACCFSATLSKPGSLGTRSPVVHRNICSVFV